MMEYKVLSDIIGRRNKIFKVGETITESDVSVGAIKSLVNRGFISPKSWEYQQQGEKIKLAIVTSVWRRPEIFKMFADGVNCLLQLCPDFELSLIVSGSEWIESKSNCDRNGGYLLGNGLKHYQYIEIPNEPLGAKVNATTYACRNMGVHYVLCMGSDDIISPELLNEYAVHMRKGIDLIGVSDFYFYDTVSKQSLYWAGYREANRKDSSIGAARCLSARLLSELNWSPWDYNSNSRLDYSMSQKIAKVKHSNYIFSMKSKGLFGVDIKSETNISKFKKWDNSEFISNDFVEKYFPYILRQ